MKKNKKQFLDGLEYVNRQESEGLLRLAVWTLKELTKKGECHLCQKKLIKFKDKTNIRIVPTKEKGCVILISLCDKCAFKNDENKLK